MGKLHSFFYGQDTNVPTKDAWIEDKLSKLPAGSSILDAGAGECRWKASCKHLKYSSQDFCQYDGTKDDTGLQLSKWDYRHIDIVSDITNIPVPDKSFDAVLCTEVLEHIANPYDALRELMRVTKDGGTLILTTPFCSLTHFAPYHFSSGFNKYWFETNLKELGATVTECTPNGDYYAWLRQEMERLPSMISKYNGKKLSAFDKLRLGFFTRWLSKFIGNNDSSELLCFGYMVIATKNKP